MVLLGWCIHDLARLFFFVFVCSFPSLPSCRIRHRPSHCIIARAHLPAFLDREKKAHIHEIDDEHRTRTWDSFFSFFAYHFLETLPIEDDRLLVESTRFLYISEFANATQRQSQSQSQRYPYPSTHSPRLVLSLSKQTKEGSKYISYNPPSVGDLFHFFFSLFFVGDTYVCSSSSTVIYPSPISNHTNLPPTTKPKCICRVSGLFICF